MQARVTTAFGPPGADKAAEGIKILRESVMPDQRQQPGHKGTLLLLDRQRGKSITVYLYETEAHAKAAEESGHEQKQISKFSHLTSGPVVQEVYEVPVQDIEMGTATAHTRVTFGQLHPGADKQAEAIQLFRESVLPEAKQQQGFKGAIMLVDASTGNVMAFTMWETEAEMQTSEQSGYYQKQAAKFGHLFPKPLVRELFEITFSEVG